MLSQQVKNKNTFNKIFSKACSKKMIAITSAMGLSIILTACQTPTGILSQTQTQPTTQQTEPISTKQTEIKNKIMTQIDHKSPYDFDTTVQKVQSAIEQSPANLFAVVPHSLGATQVGMTLDPSTLFIFGHPKVGTPALQNNPRLGMELPLKLLVWQDKTGQVFISQQNLDQIAQIYQIDPKNIASLKTGITNLISKILTESTVN